MKKVVTRFAPSPTGYLHIGGVRTALFNYIFAKKHAGEFLLRVEDTDQERSKAEYTDAIIEGLNWLGLTFDGTPTFQSQRSELYKQEIDRLLLDGKAYRCSCSPERLDTLRKEQESKGLKPMYDGLCRDKDITDVNTVVRLKTPTEGSTIVDDAVYGKIEFLNKELDDLIIQRSNGTPTYHLCNVVDDNAQGVTHIIRGEDHLPNTPRQIQIIKSLGYGGFSYAHLPLVLGEDKKRLSKRHAATDLMAYKKLGYLADAILNMLARLGWSKTEKDIFSMGFLMENLELEDIQRSGAVFDIERLNFINQNHISELSDKKLLEEIKPFNDENSYSLDAHHDPEKLVRLCCGSGNNLTEISDFIKPFIKDFEKYDEKDFEKHLLGSETVLNFFISNLPNQEDWTVDSLAELIEQAKEELQLPMPKIGLPLRVALLGRAKSPNLDATLYLFKKESVIERLQKALKTISEH
jgi:glutamyl-tRNA synthetase